MAHKRIPLILEILPPARRSLGEIWDWNAANYSPGHATDYINFLVSESEKLAADPARGRAHPQEMNVFYCPIRRPGARHGHLAIYEIVGENLRILKYFHTAQNWQTNNS